ncbi:MAG TPA: SBBP repeat-containing protein [Bryobacteraceae bacterium]|jgi:uncharacterized protein (TIGR03437 family)
MKTFCLAMAAVASCLHAASPQFLLGVDYTEWAPANVAQVATDNSGNIYVLTKQSVVAKLSADGGTLDWQMALGYSANQMAVDASGAVYILAFQAAQPASGTLSVKKFDTAGHIVWTWDSGPGQTLPTGFAVDTSGRTYVIGQKNGFVYGFAGTFLRVNASGSGTDYEVSLPEVPTSIAVAGDSSAFVAGLADHTVLFLARFAPDGSPGFFSTTTEPQSDIWPAVAVDKNGEEVLYTPGQFQRFDGNGVLTLSKKLPFWTSNSQTVLVDSAGNAYIAGSTNGIYPTLNSLAACGTQMLSVIARDGTILQTTYLPGIGTDYAVTIGANSPGVIAVGAADPNFSPSQTGPFPSNGSILLHLSPNLNAPTLPLACIGNSASYQAGAVAPGEIVALLGTGLGPQQGIQAQASLSQPFPTTIQNVQVTFDGKPAPLLWVQDAQINAVAPWSLTPGQNTRVCVLTGATTTNCLTEAVAQTSPGVFTVDGIHAAALNQDGTVNSAANPAKAGSIVTVFATGLGPITPAQNDGTLVNIPLPSNTLDAQVILTGFPTGIGGSTTYESLKVTYAGPAPYLVAGASQINFQVNFRISPFYLTAGAAAAPFNVYVAP